MKSIILTTAFAAILLTNCKSNEAPAGTKTDSSLMAAKYLFGLAARESAVWRYKYGSKDSFFVPIDDTAKGPTGQPLYDSTRLIVVSYDSSGKQVLKHPLFTTVKWVPVPAAQILQLFKNDYSGKELKLNK